jgi:hypothetical protein
MKRSIAVVALLLAAAPSVSEAQRCPGDNNGDGVTTVDEIVASVDSALNGCGDGVRFVDNGDGTISDYDARLTWEKKVDLDGSPIDCTSPAVCPDPHDADNRYTWSTGELGGPTGTAYVLFLAQLNGTCDGDNSALCTMNSQCRGIGNGLCGLGGHRDWRLPTRDELVSIVDYSDAISPTVNTVFDSACTDSCTRRTCSCTVDYYWSSSTVGISPGYAWIVNFYSGFVFYDAKAGSNYVRAVRTGL